MNIAAVAVAAAAVCAVLFLGGCGSTTPARITDESPQVAARTHIVVKGDTLYSIAWSAGVDWKALARWNRLASPDLIHPGEKLRLSAPRGQKKPPAVTAAPAVPPSPASPPAPVGNWVWPLRGKVTQQFSAAAGSNGIDIRGTPGTPVVAAAGGRVVYAGDGLSGYGNLVIIKHNDAYLSAYGHNREISVREGQNIKQGQRIGLTAGGGDTPGLMHFQIRREGKPVNPLRHLPRRGA